MTGEHRSFRSEFNIMSRALLNCANKGGTQTEFLREISPELLRFTGVDELNLWFEDHDLIQHWQVTASPSLTFSLTTEKRDGAMPEDLMNYVSAAAGEQKQRIFSAPHTLDGSAWLDDEAVFPFEIDEASQGILWLGKDQSKAFTRQRVESYEAMIQVLGVAIANHRTHAALTERVKELTCMYRIAQVAAESNLSLPKTLQEIVQLLPPAWQYPNITTARIVLEDQIFCSHEFEEGSHCLWADILVKGIPSGKVEVFYTDERYPHATTPHRYDPFLPEERFLIEGVARELTFIIERKHVEKEKLQLQDQMHHADRLATIGQLAAGVAHELNEPLGNILGFAQLAIKSDELPEQVRKDIDNIVKSSLYAREIIKKLMLFSRQTPSRKTDANINDVIEEVFSLLESRCVKGGVILEQDLDPHLPPIHGDSAQLQQIMVNLAVNAIQAMPNGGLLRVVTQRLPNEISIIFDDTGMGIKTKDLKNIFVPFFTTKDVGEGTGLGLSVAHGIITSHGGSVTVDSKVGRGSRFEIRLPLQADTSQENCDDNK